MAAEPGPNTHALKLLPSACLKSPASISKTEILPCSSSQTPLPPLYLKDRSERTEAKSFPLCNLFEHRFFPRAEITHHGCQALTTGCRLLLGDQGATDLPDISTEEGRVRGPHLTPTHCPVHPDEVNTYFHTAPQKMRQQKRKTQGWSLRCDLPSWGMCRLCAAPSLRMGFAR